ncbi:hypothetical protein GGE61_004872 [Rhizobium leguminosarum]|nr:hypothetical protein [Rhizobium leguminosarum]
MRFAVSRCVVNLSNTLIRQRNLLKKTADNLANYSMPVFASISPPELFIICLQ